MECWNELINTALLGTGKKTPVPEHLPPVLKETTDRIAEQAEDNEARFLQTAALVFNLRQSGTRALPSTTELPAPAEEEERSYCNEEAIQVLKDILGQEASGLLRLWLENCVGRSLIIRPDLIPILFRTAAQDRSIKGLVDRCCGKRGEWLSRFERKWQTAAIEVSPEVWKTGTLPERKEQLLLLRETDPAQALEWMKETWPQDDAATRAELLGLLEEHLSTIDLAFLEGLASDKSKKIKELALTLVKRIPGSPIVQQCGEVLRVALQLKKDKGFLGLKSRTGLEIHLPEIPASVFQSGIEKLSSDKNVPDDAFIVYQLMQSTPPEKYTEWWALPPGEIISLFEKDPLFQKLIPAMAEAAVSFKSAAWAEAFMQANIFYARLLPLLSPEAQEKYGNTFFADQPEPILQWALRRKGEWGLDLTRHIFRYTAKNTYQYNRAFYTRYIHLVPGRIALELEKFTPPEPHLQNMWSGNSEHILQLLHLKARIFQTLNA